MTRRPDPVFLVFMALMLFSSMKNYSGVGDWFYHMLMIIPGVVVGISFHEFAHGWVAYKLGDPTPKFQGRLTINPAAHIDPIGLVALMFAGFGWGRPVEINPANFKNRRKGEFLTAIAGVVMNLFIAVLFGFIVKLVISIGGGSFAVSSLGSIVTDVLMYVILINLVLMVFNLIPVPPLDGFTIVTELFNVRRTPGYFTVVRYGSLILLGLILFGVTGMIISPCVNAIMGLITNIIIL
jgi:Zn-dependent protease